MSKIEDLVKSYIEQSRAGQEMENSKFDFKRQWYDLTDEYHINEFLKDTTAMANTFGPDAYIAIGFDDKKKELFDTTFKDCKLNDTSDIPKLISGRVDRLFDIDVHEVLIDGHKLSVIHIPPSIDKPHVIRNYTIKNSKGEKKQEKHKIFVRRGTSTELATKNDLELMYYDRKNIVPEYELFSNYHLSSSQLTITGDSIPNFQCDLVLENVGKRSIAIRKIKVVLTVQDETYELESSTSLESKNLILTSGEIASGRFHFSTLQPLHFSNQQERNKKDHWFRLERDNIKCSDLQITFANGKVFTSKFTVLK